MFIVALLFVVLSIIISKYISNYRCKNITILGKSRVTWVLHKPFRVKDYIVLSDRSNGLRLETRGEKDRYLVEVSDDIENIPQVRSTINDINGGFSTSVGDVEGVTRYGISKYLGKHGIVNNIYMESNLGSDSIATLENEIKNNTLITVLLIDCIGLLVVGFCSSGYGMN